MKNILSIFVLVAGHCPGVKAPLYLFPKASIRCLVCHSVAVLYVFFIPFFPLCLLFPPSGLCCCVSARGKCCTNSNSGCICVSSTVSLCHEASLQMFCLLITSHLIQWIKTVTSCCVSVFCAHVRLLRIPQLDISTLTCVGFLNVLWIFLFYFWTVLSLNHNEMQ